MKAGSTRKFALFVLFSSLVALTDTRAQNFWQQTNGPYGGYIFAFAVDSNGDIFTSTLDAGVFLSTDNGASWAEVNNGLTTLDVRSLLLTSTGGLFAGTHYDGIFYSADRGANWNLISFPTNSSVLALVLSPAGPIFAGTDVTGVYRSTDNGNSWTQVNSGLPPVPVFSISANPLGHIFVGTQGGGAWLSTDNGNNWISLVSPRLQVSSLAVNSLGQVLAGTDSGVFRYDGTWSGPALSGLSIRSLAIIGDTIFAGTDFAGIFRSTDNGTNWQLVNSMVSGASVAALAVTPSRSVFAGADGRGIFVSVNNGITWFQANNGLRNGFIRTVDTDAFGNILATIFGEGIFRSTDGGASWGQINNGLTSLDIADVLVTSGGTMFAASQYGGGVFRSTNSGQSWSQMNAGLTNFDVISLAVNSSGDLFAGTAYGGIFRFLNGSSTWNQVDNIVANARVPSIAITRGDTVFAAVDSGGVYRSTDNGSSWAFVNIGLTNFFSAAVAVSPPTGTVLVATFGGGTHRSTDGGNMWTPVDVTFTYTFSVTVNADGTIFAGVDPGTVRRSADGFTWSSVNSGLRGQNVSSFVFDRYGYLFAGTDGGGVYRSVESTLPPATPTLVSPPDGAINQPTTLTLAWNTSAIATSYHLQVATDESFASGIVVNSTIVDTFIVVSGLTNDTTYYWHISATNSNGSSAYSPHYSFTTVVAPPVAPALSSPADTSIFQPTTLTLSWNASARAVSYRLQVSTNTAFSTRVVDDSTLIATSRQVGPLANSTTYFWRASATNVGGTSPYSARWSFSTVASAIVSDTVAFPSQPTASTDYKLFSLPGTSPLTVGNILSGNQGSDWRIFRDNGAPSNYLVELSASNSLVAGEGYWLLKRGDLNISRTVTMPPLTSDGTYSIPLDSGWNIIGNPFNINVAWTSVVFANSLSPPPQLISYGGAAGYNYSDTIMEPFKGYYFFNGLPALTLQTLKIPFPFGLTTQAIILPLVNWMVQVVFESDLNSDKENFIGIAPSATMEADALDRHKPPLIFDQGFLYFSRPVWDAKYSRFSSDFRPQLGEGQVWEFETHNPRKTLAKIRFSGMEQIPQEYEIKLVNLHNSLPFDLRTSDLYTYQSVTEKTPFKIIVGKSSFVQRELSSLVPTVYALDQNFPNPFNPNTTIRFSIPRDVNIRLEIFSSLGQRIKILADGFHTAATYSLLWDGTNEHGAQVSSGVYFYRLIAGGKEIQTRKMLLVR